MDQIPGIPVPTCQQVWPASSSRHSCRLVDVGTCGVCTSKLPFRVQSLFRDIDSTNPKAIKVLKRNLPHNYELLNCNPNVYLIHKFLTDKETSHLINLSKEDEIQFKSSFTEDSNNRKVISTERTSKYMTINPSKSDVIVRRIVQKASNCMGYFNDNVEPLQIVRYSRGQYFNLHHDAGTLNDEDSCIEPISPRRILTFFVYLNDCPSGEGHTAFPVIQKEVRTGPCPTSPASCITSDSVVGDVRTVASPPTPQLIRRAARQGGVKLDLCADADAGAIPTSNPIDGSPSTAGGGADPQSDECRGAVTTEGPGCGPIAIEVEDPATLSDPLDSMLSVRPQAGCALLFCNFHIPAAGNRNVSSADPNPDAQTDIQYVSSDSALYPLLPGCPDPRVIHSATPVFSKGVVKYGMNIWVTDEHAFNQSHDSDSGRRKTNAKAKAKAKCEGANTNSIDVNMAPSSSHVGFDSMELINETLNGSVNSACDSEGTASSAIDSSSCAINSSDDEKKRRLL